MNYYNELLELYNILAIHIYYRFPHLFFNVNCLFRWVSLLAVLLELTRTYCSRIVLENKSARHRYATPSRISLSEVNRSIRYINVPAV